MNIWEKIVHGYLFMIYRKFSGIYDFGHKISTYKEIFSVFYPEL